MHGHMNLKKMKGFRNKQLNVCVSTVDNGNDDDDDVNYDNALFPNSSLGK
jgi:hypothetical protein